MFLLLYSILYLYPFTSAAAAIFARLSDRLSALNSHAEIQAHLLVVVWPCTGTTWGLHPLNTFLIWVNTRQVTSFRSCHE